MQQENEKSKILAKFDPLKVDIIRELNRFEKNISLYEQGMQNTPLTDLVKKDISQLEESRFVINLLCGSSNLAAKAVEWLAPGLIQGNAPIVPPGFDYVQLLPNMVSHELIVDADGKKSSYTNFVDLIEKSSGFAKTKPLKILYPYKDSNIDVSLIVPASLELIESKPALNSFFISMAHGVAVVVDLQSPMPEKYQKFHDLTVKMYDYILFLVVVKETPGDNSREIESSLQKIFPESFSKKGWEIVYLVEGQSDAYPEIILHTGRQLRDALFLNKASRKIGNNLNLVVNALEVEKTEVSNRKSVLQKGNASSQNRGKLDKIREVTQNFRNKMQDVSANTDTILKDRQQERLRLLKMMDPSKVDTAAPHLKALLEECNSFQSGHLDVRTVDSKTKKVSIQDAWLQKLNDMLETAGNEFLRQDNNSILSVHDELTAEFIQQTKPFYEQVAASSIDLSQIKLSFQKGEFAVRYSGQIPNLGSFSSVFSNSRNVLMPLLGMSGLVIGLINAISQNNGIKVGFTIGIALANIGTLLYLGYHAPIEEAKKLEEEVAKVKDTITNEISRCIQDILRTSNEQQVRVMRAYHSNLTRQLDSATKSYEVAIEKESVETKAVLDRKVKTNDEKIREIENTLREVDRNRQELQKLFAQVSREFNSLF